MQSKDKTTTSTQSLMPSLQPQVNSYLGKVGNVYNPGGYLPKVNTTTKAALNQTKALAKQPVPGLTEAQGMVTGLLGNGGMTAGMQQASDYLTPFASGEYQEDPRLLATLERERNNATNAAATRFGGGRYGAAGMGTGMGQAQAAATDSLMLQSNENARNRQMQAAQAMGALGQSGAGNALTAGSMVNGLNDLRYDGTSRLASVGDYFGGYKSGQMQQFAGALSPFLGAGVTTTNRSPGPTAAQSILGGAATGGALLGPWGSVAGGLLGAFG